MLLLSIAPVGAQQIDYQRQVETAPTEESIGEGYVTPEVQRPRPRAALRQVADVVLLGLAMAVAAWLALWRRRRGWLVALTAVCVAYFGFFREGCICPIGSIQNVATALVDPGYAVPYYVIAIFVLPLIAALFFGRVFCSGVCALGAIQELMVLKPIKVPVKLDRALGWLRWVYLVLAVTFAVLPAIHRDFVICRFDPFVGVRRTVPVHRHDLAVARRRSVSGGRNLHRPSLLPLALPLRRPAVGLFPLRLAQFFDHARS
jgi:hypothetical protein